MMYCDLGSLMQILIYGPWKIKVYKTKANNRSGVIEIAFNLDLKGLLICAVINLAPEQFLKKCLKTFFSASSYSEKMRCGWSCQLTKQKIENFMKIPATEMEMVRLAILSFKV